MKSNKLTLAAIIALCGFMAYGTLAKAEDTKPAAPGEAPSAPATPPKGKGGKGGPLMEVIQSLNLTDDQKEQVKPVLKAQNEKMQALRQEGNLTREEKMAKAKAAMDETKEKLKTILTPEQFTKFEEGVKNLRPGGPGGAGHKKPAPDGSAADASSSHTATRLAERLTPATPAADAPKN